jgi:hypothetical protein
MGVGGVLSHSGVSRPHSRRDSFVPSVLELGVPLGGQERAASKN